VTRSPSSPLAATMRRSCYRRPGASRWPRGTSNRCRRAIERRCQPASRRLPQSSTTPTPHLVWLSLSPMAGRMSLTGAQRKRHAGQPSSWPVSLPLLSSLRPVLLVVGSSRQSLRWLARRRCRCRSYRHRWSLLRWHRPSRLVTLGRHSLSPEHSRPAPV